MRGRHADDDRSATEVLVALDVTYIIIADYDALRRIIPTAATFRRVRSRCLRGIRSAVDDEDGDGRRRSKSKPALHDSRV
jgi:hypothetical protein